MPDARPTRTEPEDLTDRDDMVDQTTLPVPDGPPVQHIADDTDERDRTA